MRAWFFVLLAACGSSETHADASRPDTGSPCGSGGDNSDCYCDGETWHCSTCTFGEGRDPVPCTTPGASCVIENWEHGCDCSCDPSGYWACAGETIGSTCPTLPDAGGDAGADAP